MDLHLYLLFLIKILIFSGLFLHRLSRILNIMIKFQKVKTYNFSRQKRITRRDNKKNSHIWKTRKKTPNCHTKNRPFAYWIFWKDRICYILSSRAESLEHIGFDSDGSTVIVDSSENAPVCSEEDMFNDKIEPLICNRLADICGKYLIPKAIATVRWYWTDDEVQIHTKKLNNLL